MWCFVGQTWAPYPNRSPLVTVEPDGTVWFSERGTSISCFDGETWSSFTAGDVEVLDYNYHYPSSTAVAPDGVLWVVSSGAGFSRFDEETWTTHIIADGLLSNEVSYIGRRA